MQTLNERPNRRPRLFLPLFLTEAPARRSDPGEARPFPLTPDQLRRSVAERVD